MILLKVDSSYPTYEEWKLKGYTNTTKFDLGSYPTYEEWKLRKARNIYK